MSQVVKKKSINEALPLAPVAIKVLAAIAKNPKAAIGAAQLAIAGAAAGLRGMGKAQDAIWSKGWVKLYAYFLKKQYGEDFMKMVHDLSSSPKFKSMLKTRARQLTVAKNPKQKKAVDDEFMKQVIKLSDLEFPEHTKILQQGLSDTEKNITTFVDKEYDFRYNPAEPGTGDPEYQTRKQKHLVRRKKVGKYKDALRKATILNPKTGNKIKLVTALRGNYDEEFKQQAQDLAKQLLQKHTQ